MGYRANQEDSDLEDSNGRDASIITFKLHSGGIRIGVNIRSNSDIS
jgi:hypothetical protein